MIHPVVQASAHLFQHNGHREVIRQVKRFIGIEDQVVELLQWPRAFLPTIRQEEILAGAIITVGQDWPQMVVETADILPTCSTNCTQRFIRRVIGDLRENSIVYLCGFTMYQGE